MIVLQKTMDAAVAAERERGAAAVLQLARSYGDALSRVTTLQQQLSAWLINRSGDISPSQMAQIFYAQNDYWQAEFFNSMQGEVLANHAAQPPGGPSPGVPAGEVQWYHMAAKLNRSGFETIEAMFDHACHHNAEGGAK